MTEIYFDDIPVGFRSDAGPYVVTEEEIVEFGRRFDPRPFHTDPVAARNSVFGGLVAPGSLIFAIRSALVSRLPQRPAYLAGLGLETMDLLKPVRPGDNLFLSMTCVDKRESQSRTNAGIVRFNNVITNQNNEEVMTMIAKVLVAKHRN